MVGLMPVRRRRRVTRSCSWWGYATWRVGLMPVRVVAGAHLARGGWAYTTWWGGLERAVAAAHPARGGWGIRRGGGGLDARARRAPRSCSWGGWGCMRRGGGGLDARARRCRCAPRSWGLVYDVVGVGAPCTPLVQLGGWGDARWWWA
jgi:hypothetical protein